MTTFLPPHRSPSERDGCDERGQTEVLGLVIDQDRVLSDGRRTVQLIPRKSATATDVAVAVRVAAAGTLNATALTVTEMADGRAELSERGVAVMDITLLGGGGGGKFISCPVRCN